MRDNSMIYKKFAKYVPLNEMDGFQWFALTPDYGTTYGDISRKYRFKKEPKLLDIGDANVRSMIVKRILSDDPNSMIKKYSDPDEQYSGGKRNKLYHELVKQYFGNEYDGTIIDENHLEGNDEYSIEDLEGPSEIVLWHHYPELLEEIEQSGGMIKTRKTRKTRKPRNHKKTKKTKRKRTIPKYK